MLIAAPPAGLLPLTPSPGPDASDVVEGATSVLAVVVAVAAAVVLALLLAEVIAAVVRAAGRRTWLAENLSRRARRPLRAVLVTTAVWLALRIVSEPETSWRAGVDHLGLILLIVSLAWLIGALAFVVEDAALARYRTDVPDNRHARRVRTQVMVLRRVTVAVLVVCAVAGVLLTFESARTFGATLLASAGLASIILGLAAQSTLANVFAGLQLAFTDAIRVDDVVVVEDEWGRIEEITMTYVVVHVWDDRRLILPSTWFTTTPFENWTRRAADLLGTVELDLDWAVPVDEMRAELTRLLQGSELWDHRVGVLQVTEATGGLVRVRALASAADAPTLFDLRCHVREGLVAWLQREHPEALPRTRVDGLGGLGATAARPATTDVPATADGPTTSGGVPATTGDVPRRRRDQRTPTPGSGTHALPAPGTGTGTHAMPTVGRDDDASAAAESAPGREPAQDEPQREMGPGLAALLGQEPVPGQHDTVRLDVDRHSRLFTGSLQAVERSRAFTGPGQQVIEERELTAKGLPVPTESGRTPVVRSESTESGRTPAVRSEPTGTGEPTPPEGQVDGPPDEETELREESMASRPEPTRRPTEPASTPLPPSDVEQTAVLSAQPAEAPEDPAESSAPRRRSTRPPSGTDEH